MVRHRVHTEPVWTYWSSGVSSFLFFLLKNKNRFRTKRLTHQLSDWLITSAAATTTQQQREVKDFKVLPSEVSINQSVTGHHIFPQRQVTESVYCHIKPEQDVLTSSSITDQSLIINSLQHRSKKVKVNVSLHRSRSGSQLCSPATRRQPWN